ncbi:hypothetical protein PIB30_087500 [Stylosanthes scabra]|uniref:Putative plant transposon protein domain-containing protein n=1 Tax=Stylosanthes scabra TaxID=79078 RepID=A0ABU6XU19_9FABA|nr:hypothetical protein [Stylosanthes scabra]
MIEGNQELDAVIRDLCVEGSVWSLGTRNNPLYLKRSDLNPIARGWHEFIIHNIMPTTNQSEVTLNRAVLIHCIMSSQEVRVEKIIVDAMINIITKLHATKLPLSFPNIIARLCEEMEPYFQQEQPANAPNMPQGYGWGQLQEDMANLNKNQTEFYDKILAQQATYGLGLQDLETRQEDMWVEQQQFHQDVRSYQAQQKEQFQLFQEEQEKMHRELMNHRKNFSTHMGKVHTAQEENKAKLNQINQVVLSHSLDSQAGNMYTHFGLQQGFPSLVPITPSKIPGAIKNNFRAGKPLFEGMLRPWPPEGSTSATGQQEPPTVDVPRDQNADLDNY